MQNGFHIPKKNIAVLICFGIIAIAQFLEPKSIGLSVLLVVILIGLVIAGLRILLQELKKRLL